MSSYYILLTIIVYFAVLLGIARLSSNKKSNNDAFFRGNRESRWYVVSFGMIGASLSGVTFVSVPGMVASIDFTYMQMVFGFFFGYLVVAHLLLPLYYKLNLISIYTYLGERFGQRSYLTGASFFLLSRMLGASARLYLVCYILYRFVFEEMNVPFWLVAVSSVTLIWLYTHRGGIKTIVWTDTLLTFCLLAALVLIVMAVSQLLEKDLSGVCQLIRENEHTRIFVFDDWYSRQNFFKQFFSGVFITIVMTGLDQDMMQKNLSCRTLKESQRNMYCYGFSFIPVNFLFLALGVLLIAVIQTTHLSIPTGGDDMLPMLATQGYLGASALILFTIGIIAAAFSSADSALTALTTSFCIDILHTDKKTYNAAIKQRRQTHILMCITMAVIICLFWLINNKSVIDAIYILASYTYGPLLGLFAFGLFTNRRVADGAVPFIAIASPLLCLLVDKLTNHLTGYQFGYEMLMLNGMLTFSGLWLSGNRKLTLLNN